MDKNLEKIARAFRDSMYGKPADELTWGSCRENWMKDARIFLDKLAAAGLEITEIKKKPTTTTTPPVDERGSMRSA